MIYNAFVECVDAVLRNLEAANTKKLYPIRIVKNGVATIVFWQDGTKTIVKRAPDEPESDYAAFTAAVGIKLYGSNSALKRIVARTETQKPKKQKEKKQKEKKQNES